MLAEDDKHCIRHYEWINYMLMTWSFANFIGNVAMVLTWDPIIYYKDTIRLCQ